MKPAIPAALIAVLASTLPSARCEVLVADDFDDGVLDPGWEIRLIDAADWTGSESGTEFSVTDIDTGDSYSRWAFVVLYRPCPLEWADFHADFDFSWDCADTNVAMQIVRIELVGVDSRLRCSAGFQDAWLHSGGCRYARTGGDNVCVPDELPHAGDASIDIDRTNNHLTIAWDGSLLLEETYAAHVMGVQLVFGYYGSPTSVFGTESIDLVRVERTTVSVDPGTWGRTKALYR